MKSIRDKNLFGNSTRLAEMIIFIVCVGIICFFFSEGISGNDFWWHIKIGEWIVEHRQIPTTAIYSWIGTEKGISWTAHEWLSEVLFYGIFTVLGESGIFWMCLILAILLFALLWREAWKLSSRHIILMGVFFVLFAVTESLFFYGRPHIFSYFLLYFELKILYGYLENPKSKAIYLLPFIACLWSNLHGGSANLSYLLCLLFLFTGLIHMKFGKIHAVRMEKKSLIRLAGITIAAALGVLVNPIGVKVFLFPYTSMSDSLMMSIIGEWQAPDAKSMAQLILYFLPIIISCLCFAASEKPIRLSDLLLMGFFLFLFFRSARFIMLCDIAAVFCAFPYMQSCNVAPFKRKWEKWVITAVLVGALVLPIYDLYCIFSNFYFSKTSDSVMTENTALEENELQSNTDVVSEEAESAAEMISTELPADMLEVVCQDNPSRLFNDYNLGGELIYHDIEVFFDGRADMYGAENILSDGISLLYLRQQTEDAENTAYVDVDALVEEYDFDAFLILNSRPLYSYLISHPEKYELIYENDSMGYFVFN